ncbi:uncharacterized protein LOC135464585 isoform X2 [Liolophura sinensis]|uniref:uncharacterized protein LOC135464585 isoform X2 n=1 Tax=Liolophura sinensis TaxID=3198878 RepID=UPI003158D118
MGATTERNYLTCQERKGGCFFPPLDIHSLVGKKTPRKKKKRKLYTCSTPQSLTPRLLGEGFLPPVLIDSIRLTFMMSLLDSKKGTSLLDGSLLSAKAPKGRPYSDEVPPDGHFPRSFDTSSIGSNRSGKLLQQQQASQQLPPIIDEGGDISSPYTVLPPIQDARVPVEKEDGKMDVPLVNIEPPTPQHSTLTNLPQSVRGGPSREPTIPPTEESTHEDDEGAEWGVDITETEILERAREASMIRRESERELAGSGAQDGEKVQHSPRSKGPVLAAGSHLHSSRESLAESSTGSQVHLPGTLPSWKGSQPSLKSGGGTHSKKGGSSRQGDGSYKGSVVYGPDGEAINVGGAVGLPDSPVPVLDINKLLDGAESAVSEDSGHLSDDEGRESFRSSAQHPSQPWPPGTEGYKQLQQKRDTDARSGDLDAQMSIHSWSYTPKDQEQSPHSPRTQRSLSESTARSRRSSDKASVLAEQGLIEALTEHAQRIAADVLNQGDAGVNLADDIKSAAEQIARSQHRKSADPSVAEYKELIRKTLSSAVAKQMGIEDGVLPDDTEISPEVMDALTNQSLTPDDLEVVQTESGRSIIQARSAASSPLKEGHLYQPAPGKNGSHPSSAKSSKPPISIPNDRQTTADIGELDVLNFGFAEQENQEGGLSPQKTSPAHSAKSRRLSDQLSVPDTEVKAPSGKRSQGSGTSQRSEKSKVSNSAKTPEQELADLMKELHVDSPGDKTPSSGKKSKSSVKSQKVSRNSLDGRDEFVVGKVEDKKELEKLYAPIEPPPPKNVPKADGKPKLKKKSRSFCKNRKKRKEKGRRSPSLRLCHHRKCPLM